MYRKNRIIYNNKNLKILNFILSENIFLRIIFFIFFLKIKFFSLEKIYSIDSFYFLGKKNHPISHEFQTTANEYFLCKT